MVKRLLFKRYAMPLFKWYFIKINRNRLGNSDKPLKSERLVYLVDNLNIGNKRKEGDIFG